MSSISFYSRRRTLYFLILPREQLHADGAIIHPPLPSGCLNGCGVNRRDESARAPIGRAPADTESWRAVRSTIVWRQFLTEANAVNETLAQHLWNHQDDLFTFLRQPGLDATNWRAELAIRFGGILRKLCGGSRT